MKRECENARDKEKKGSHIQISNETKLRNSENEWSEIKKIYICAVHKMHVFDDFDRNAPICVVWIWMIVASHRIRLHRLCNKKKTHLYSGKHTFLLKRRAQANDFVLHFFPPLRMCSCQKPHANSNKIWLKKGNRKAKVAGTQSQKKKQRQHWTHTHSHHEQ